MACASGGETSKKTIFFRRIFVPCTIRMVILDSLLVRMQKGGKSAAEEQPDGKRKRKIFPER